MAKVLVALAASLSTAGLGCSSYPGACEQGTSETRTFEARGLVTVGRTLPLACGEQGGIAFECGGPPADLCCEYDFGSDPVEGCEARQSCCVARALAAARPAADDLPTFLEIDCPFVQLSFLLPDPRDCDVGRFALPLGVVAWDTPDSDRQVASARVRVAGFDWYVGEVLALDVEVVEKSGGARASGERLATDDFAVRLRIVGALRDTEEEGDVPMIALELELSQTAEDYADAGCD